MDDLHPLAIEHLPPFITPPGKTDVLFVAMGIFLLLAIVGIGVFYFKLHALPEQTAHRGQKVQYEIVAVLALLSLFTHNHVFWIAALLLAFVPLPDFGSPLASMAQSLHRIADRLPPAVADAQTDSAGNRTQPATSDAPPPTLIAQHNSSDSAGDTNVERPKD